VHPGQGHFALSFRTCPTVLFRWAPVEGFKSENAEGRTGSCTKLLSMLLLADCAERSEKEVLINFLSFKVRWVLFLALALNSSHRECRKGEGLTLPPKIKSDVSEQGCTNKKTPPLRIQV
jgi:hypothetical protein